VGGGWAGSSAGVVARTSEVRAKRTLFAHGRSIISFYQSGKKGLGGMAVFGMYLAFSGALRLAGSPRDTSHFQLVTRPIQKPNQTQDRKPNSR